MGTFFKAIFAGIGVVIGIVFAIFVGLAMLISSSSNGPDKTSNREIVRFTATELYDSYNTNGVAFDAYFIDKIVEVTGSIKSVNKDILGGMFVMLNVDHTFGQAAVHMIKSDEATVAKLRKNLICPFPL